MGGSLAGTRSEFLLKTRQHPLSSPLHRPQPVALTLWARMPVAVLWMKGASDEWRKEEEDKGQTTAVSQGRFQKLLDTGLQPLARTESPYHISCRGWEVGLGMAGSTGRSYREVK